MVVINRPDPQILNAYATSPLTPTMNKTVQHGFYDGTYARYDAAIVVVAVHDRPEFHGMSHYDLRLQLDSEGLTAPFLVVDESTPELDAIWYVEDTETCKLHSDPADFGDEPPPIKYPDEDFILWQAHIRTADLPQQWAAWDVGCGDLVETLASHGYRPYDPHDPQHHIINSGTDWTDPATSAKAWGFVYLQANASDEVEWSDKTEDVARIAPRRPVVARLTPEAARLAGLTPVWSPQERVARGGEMVRLIANWDWTNPMWPRGYPDERNGSGRDVQTGESDN